ncbi:hypothetical protein BOW48_12490 [Solemya velum gill symbiont]|nr:hypothetical protein BOW48_12490 [Solemya velum gill symbiont]
MTYQIEGLVEYVTTVTFSITSEGWDGVIECKNYTFTEDELVIHQIKGRGEYVTNVKLSITSEGSGGVIQCKNQGFTEVTEDRLVIYQHPLPIHPGCPGVNGVGLGCLGVLPG